MRKLCFPAALVSLAALSPFGCGTERSEAQPAEAKNGAIEMQVTEAGFVPDHIKVKVGQLVKLVITRKTDATCAKAIVIDEFHVHQDLPLNQAVTVAFTPHKSGELKYGCAMNKMVSGVMVIE